MSWQDKKFITLDDLLQFMKSTKPDVSVAYRGQPDISLYLLSSLDRLLAIDMRYEYRLAEETAIIVKFCQLAKEFCDDTEKEYLQGPMPQDRIKALPILQHHNAPTRLLDWTAYPLVALYFAAIHHHDKDGAIWWFKRKAFYDEVGQRWEKYGLSRHPEQNNGIDLNDTAFNTDGPAWITELNCMVPFHRIKVQQGFFTVAGRLASEHSDLIAKVLKEEEYGRIIIPHSWKQQILDRLRIMNIHSSSIDYPGADLAGMHLAQCLKTQPQY
jgi:hypothetical protein